MNDIYTNEWHEPNISVFSSCLEIALGKSNEEMGGQLLKPLSALKPFIANSPNTTNH